MMTPPRNARSSKFRPSSSMWIFIHDGHGASGSPASEPTWNISEAVLRTFPARVSDRQRATLRSQAAGWADERLLDHALHAARPVVTLGPLSRLSGQARNADHGMPYLAPRATDPTRFQAIKTARPSPPGEAARQFLESQRAEGSHLPPTDLHAAWASGSSPGSAIAVVMTSRAATTLPWAATAPTPPRSV